MYSREAEQKRIEQAIALARADLDQTPAEDIAVLLECQSFANANGTPAHWLRKLNPAQIAGEIVRVVNCGY